MSDEIEKDKNPVIQVVVKKIRNLKKRITTAEELVKKAKEGIKLDDLQLKKVNEIEHIRAAIEELEQLKEPLSKVVEIQEEEHVQQLQSANQQLRLLVELILLPAYFNSPDGDERRNRISQLSKIPIPQLTNLAGITNWLFPKIIENNFVESIDRTTTNIHHLLEGDKVPIPDSSGYSNKNSNESDTPEGETSSEESSPKVNATKYSDLLESLNTLFSNPQIFVLKNKGGQSERQKNKEKKNPQQQSSKKEKNDQTKSSSSIPSQPVTSKKSPSPIKGSVAATNTAATTSQSSSSSSFSSSSSSSPIDSNPNLNYKSGSSSGGATKEPQVKSFEGAGNVVSAKNQAATQTQTNPQKTEADDDNDGFITVEKKESQKRFVQRNDGGRRRNEENNGNWDNQGDGGSGGDDGGKFYYQSGGGGDNSGGGGGSGSGSYGGGGDGGGGSYGGGGGSYGGGGGYGGGGSGSYSSGGSYGSGSSYGGDSSSSNSGSGNSSSGNSSSGSDSSSSSGNGYQSGWD